MGRRQRQHCQNRQLAGEGLGRGHADLDPGRSTGPGDSMQQPYNRGMERIVEMGQARVRTIDGQRVLHKVVRPNGEEVAVPS